MAKKRISSAVKANANAKTLRRIIILLAVLGVAIFLPLFYQLYQLQIVQYDTLQERAINQQTKDVEISSMRGSIYDKNGTILAMSASVHNVIISPRDIEADELDKDAIAAALAEILDKDKDDILARMERTNSAYELIARKVEEDVAEQVRAFISEYNAQVKEYNKTAKSDEQKSYCSSGLYLMPDTKRYYPYNNTAAQIIGFVDADNNGAYGIEALYDELLAGRTGRVVTARSGTGTELPFRYEDIYDAESGYNLNLTIDANIQRMAENTLAEGIEEFEVQEGAFCIVMNAKTGAILALANSPNYDLNSPWTISDSDTAAYLDTLTGDEYTQELGNAQYAQWRNKALSDTYEPGSTFKAVVLAMALEDGVISENDTFYCSGSVTIAGQVIRCSNRSGHGSQTLSEAVENSCNPAFIAIGQKIGATRFYDYLEDFGFLNVTGVDLQGEANSIIWSREDFSSAEGILSVATASFGQTLKVSPMQLITAAAAAVNGGHLMQPYVLDSITASDGTVLQQNEPNEVRQVVSEETSALVRQILENVVSQGTGKNAYVAGYRIGGKTGTSQKRDETSGNVIVSFLGVAPANDPEIIVLLAYDSPKPTVQGGNYTSRGFYISGGYMGASKAGPLIGEILDYMGIEKQYSTAELDTVDTLVPSLVGLSEESAAAALEEKGFTYRTVGEGDVVTAQVPTAGAAIPGGSRVVLYFGDAQPQESVTVPNVIGYGPDYAKQVLATEGLYIRMVGISGTYTTSTIANNQSIEAGTEVKPGTVIEVQFSDRSVTE